MGKKERSEREVKRENYATKHSAEKRKQTLIAIGVLSIIIVIVGYAGWMFINMTDSAPGGPENAGVINSEHSHTGILVKIFGDPFDFSAPAYQIKSPWIHFEGRDGSTVHKHATGVTLGYLFESLALELDDQCFVFQDGRSFCSNDDYKLSFFVNGEQVTDLRDIEPKEDDKVLITYGAETPEEIQSQILELENQELIK